LFEADLNIYIPFSITLSLVSYLPLFVPIQLSRQKKILGIKVLEGIALFVRPFCVTLKGLIKMDRHQITHEIKFSCRMILEGELKENFIKLLYLYEKHINT